VTTDEVNLASKQLIMLVKTVALEVTCSYSLEK